ncbi:probable E3 ubiquitin-protein ligase ARI9 [Abrus precatorius]|uniref:RBR-type E3 ubiquitin transferase n=1 Tax=Abrus precatorius TaxID=3816 RepID=A0A8B8K3R4_ABRPR|nr:probable E3 ubiquitin-protein ligase ARI9 [Abrus precatorius]
MGNKLCVSIKSKNKASEGNDESSFNCLDLESIAEYFRPSYEDDIRGTILYTCKICCESKSLNDSFSVEPCGHFYCFTCTVRYIVSKLQNNVLIIKCPERECFGELSPHVCKPILPTNVLERWEKALCESVIPEEERFYCPFNDCSALLLINDGRMVIRNSTCPHCKRAICVQCNAPWHQKITCQKYKKLNENKNDDLLLNLAKKRKWKRCPNCKHYVEKNNGCDYMTCRLVNSLLHVPSPT